MKWFYEFEVYDSFEDEDNFRVSGNCYGDDAQVAQRDAMEDIYNRFGSSVMLYEIVKFYAVE